MQAGKDGGSVDDLVLTGSNASGDKWLEID